MDPINLPTELSLYFLSFLPLRQILALGLTSKSWHSFLKEHEATVYRAAAILHSFATPHQLSWDCTPPDVFPLLEGVHSWKDFCRKRFLLEMCWTGTLPVHGGMLSCLRGVVHRVKIDEQQGTAIVTFWAGGLSVCCIRSDMLLWALDPGDVRSYAHCEFSNGYLIFDRLNSNLEVWRRERDLSQNPISTSPDARQLAAASGAYQLSQDARGVFVPVRVICPPSSIRAYRFVYPTLLVASEAAQEVYLFNIPSGELEARISIAVDADEPCLVTYVELNERHVFVCTENHGLLIFPRSGAASGILRFVPGDSKVPWNFDFSAITEDPATLHPYSEIDLERPDKFPIEYSPACAVHVSSCGSHIVLAVSDGIIFIIRDFEDTLKQAGPLQHPISVIYVGDVITDLAYEDNRVAFHAADIGILVIPHVLPDHVPASSRGEIIEPKWPRLFAAHLHSESLLDLDVYSEDLCGCVQITRTGLWIVSADVREGMPVSELKYLNFSYFPQFP